MVASVGFFFCVTCYGWLLFRATSLDQMSVARNPDGHRWSLRWILVHMIEEYARHCGHADLIREAIVSTGGNQTRAAERLGITRRVLKLKIDRYGLSLSPSEQSKKVE